jgi:glycosyltransferase involved in cell wall biosynthesis
MITYNHEKYIREAIEGVLMQQVDFNVELIIADDNSPDNTEQIVADIIGSHPNGKWIRYTKHKSNKGMMPNFVWSLEQCKGKYIALCEGDDYWTDPYKLQKQVDFLERNEEYVACFHDVKIVTESSKRVAHLPYPKQNRLTFTDILNNHYVYTCSLVFRNQFCKFPDWLLHIKSGDIALAILLAHECDFYYFYEILSVYRVHAGGVSSTNDHQDDIRYFRGRQILYKHLNGFFDKRYDQQFKKRSLAFFYEMFPKKGGRKKVILHYLLRLILLPGRV